MSTLPLLKESVEALNQAIGSDDLLRDMIVRVVIECLDKYQKKVNVGIQDSVKDLLDAFKQRMQTEMFGVAEHWMLSSQHERFLFPTNCRFLTVKGQSIVAVIENQAGPRTLFLDEKLCMELRSEVHRTQVTARPHTLALPYTYFVLHFLGTNRPRLANSYIAWRTTPVQRLADDVFDPILPNIHTNYCICTGQANFRSETVSELCDEFIEYFWGSTFNSDLSSFWWAGRNSHPWLRTVPEWENATKENPYFFNEFTVALKSSNRTLESMINACLTGEQGDDIIKLRHRLADSIEKCSDALFEKIMRYLKKTKFDKYYPADVTNALRHAVAEIFEDVSSIATCLQKELNVVSPRDYGWESRSPAWTNERNDDVRIKESEGISGNPSE